MANFTKAAIMESFLRLLNEKKFDKITIKDIVSDCGVSRKTFYYYFEDIYDILEKYMADLTDESIKNIDNVQTFETELIRLIGFITENKRAVYHIYNSVSRDKLEDYLYESSLPVIKAIILKKLDNSPYSSDDIDIISKVCANAFTGSILRWIKDGMPDNIEYMIKLISTIFDDAVNAIQNRSIN